MTFHTVTYCKKANKNVTIIYRHSGMLREGLGQSYRWKKWRTGKHARVKRERNWSLIEIVLKKIEGYVIKNYIL